MKLNYKLKIEIGPRTKTNVSITDTAVNPKVFSLRKAGDSNSRDLGEHLEDYITSRINQLIGAPNE